ncbi:hypothetical protein AAF712_006325 [Marasmius tenuissimus]|uniref:F-box domain-containing protein n=1 Tax=Marasmius tenuissimus TaxID=585030 RepID=A0ABR2ZYE5_9AGAR
MEQQRAVLRERCHREIVFPNNSDTIEPRFLRSDYVLTEVEASQMKILLDAEQLALAKYRKEVARLPTATDDMEKRMTELEEVIKRRHAAVSAQRRVPIELWQKIFNLIAHSSTKGGYSLKVHEFDQAKWKWQRPTLILSRVCSLWRRVALDTPSLWASISLDLSNAPGIAPWKLLGLYLQNSKQYPLRIQISDGHWARGCPRHIEDCWNTLLPHLHRCRSLDADDLSSRLVIPEGSFPNLTNLSERGHEKLYWHVALQDTPKLTQVASDFLYPLSQLPYHQLTSLAFEFLVYDNIHTLVQDVLPNCGKLESLTFKDLEDDDSTEESESHPLVDIRSLRSLSIYVTRECVGGPLEVSSPILSAVLALRAPALSNLRLTFSDPGHVERWPGSLSQFCSQNSTSLRTLSLSIIHFDTVPLHPNLVSLLQLTRNVIKLDIVLDSYPRNKSETSQYHSFLQQLLRHLFSGIQAERPLLPHLEDISITVMDSMLLCEQLVDTVLDAVHSRFSEASSVGGGASLLTEVRLVCVKTTSFDGRWERFSLSPGAAERIQGLLRHGVRVDIGEGGGGGGGGGNWFF